MLSNGYILILIWLAVVGIFFAFVNVYKLETVNGEKVYRMYFLPALILFLPIIFMAGFRGNLLEILMYTWLIFEIFGNNWRIN